MADTSPTSSREIGVGAGPTDIGLDELDRLLAVGATLIEVLPAGEYDEEHLPGAINLPLKKLDAAAVGTLPADRPVVVYCWDSL